MDAIEYNTVAEAINRARHDTEDWDHQTVVGTVIGRIVQRLCEQFSAHDKRFDAHIFTKDVYDKDFGSEIGDDDIPF